MQIFFKFHNVHLPVISDVMEKMRRNVSLDLDRSIYLKTVWKQKKTQLNRQITKLVTIFNFLTINFIILNEKYTQTRATKSILGHVLLWFVNFHLYRHKLINILCYMNAFNIMHTHNRK